MKTLKSLSLIALLAVAATLFVAAPASADSTDLSTRRFQTPSGNIHCLMQDGGLLRCDILSGLNPEPDKKCELDWVGLLLPRAKTARPNCAGDTVADQSAPVLQYGERWERRGRRCVSKRSGLYCQSFGGWHFKLSREDWDTWYTP